MKAVILAGGLGTRLRPLSCTRPKTLFPILNKPLLQLIFEKLAQNNITEVILAVNQQTALRIKQQRIPKHGLTVKYSHDPHKTPLGTAGPIKKAEKLIGHDEPFLVINGDILTNLNYHEVLETHKKTRATATIALCEVEDPSRYGVAETAENNRITRFIEKPPKGTAPTNLINAGIYALSPSIFQYIPKGKAVSLEREVFPKLAQQGKLYGHVTKDMWIDIGKPEEYLQTNKLLLDKAHTTQKHPHKYTLKPPTAIDKHVIIGEKAIIGPYAVIGKNVTIGKNTKINNTVIFPNTTIADNTTITNAIIGENATIGKNVKINKGCIIADKAKIKDNITLTTGTAVCPAKEVSENILKTKLIY
jgi:NDP-sugar pyrophosphorylase family protein